MTREEFIDQFVDGEEIIKELDENFRQLKQFGMFKIQLTDYKTCTDVFLFSTRDIKLSSLREYRSIRFTEVVPGLFSVGERESYQFLERKKS